MTNLGEFLLSKEIIVIYIIAGIACLICFIVYLIEKHNRKSKLRHNTRELNKLVEEVQEEYPEDNNKVIYQEPILENIEDVKEASNLEELLEKTLEIEKIKEDTNYEVSFEEVNDYTEEPVIIEELDNLVYESDNDNYAVEKKEEELEYTSIEPDQVTAQIELQKLTEELMKQEEVENSEDIVTNYEEMQEETAIISLDELLKRGKELYEANESTQYKDEGNEPISLQELEEKTGSFRVVNEGVFNINEVVPKEESSEAVIVSSEEVKPTSTVTLYDFNNAPYEKVSDEEVRKFKSSPIISPIFGIEKDDAVMGLELENTANYEKLDKEIKKTNEFLMTLKELQKNIDN